MPRTYALLTGDNCVSISTIPIYSGEKVVYAQHLTKSEVIPGYTAFVVQLYRHEHGHRGSDPGEEAITITFSLGLTSVSFTVYLASGIPTGAPSPVVIAGGRTPVYSRPVGTDPAALILLCVYRLVVRL